MYKRFENIILATLFVGALALGFWGYGIAGSNYIAASNGGPGAGVPTPANPLSWIEAVRCIVASIGLMRLVDLFQPGKDPWQLVIAQFAVPGVALVSALQLFVTGVRKNIRTAMARRKTNHTIVCGIGDVGMQVIQNLRGAGHHVVAVDLVTDSPGAATCENSGVPVLQGDAKNPQVLLASGLRHAQTVIVSTGSDSENFDVALQIRAMHAKRSIFKAGKIQVLAEVRNDWMHKRLMASGSGSLGTANVDLRLFNPFTNAARMLIKRLHLPPTPEFEAGTFVVIGFGAYGREIALQLIRSAPVALGQTLRILAFDQKADEAREKFPITDAAAAEMAAVEFVAADVMPGSTDLKQVVEKKLESAGPLLGVALALGDDETSLCSALEMRSLLDRIGHLHVPIYVRLEHYRQLGELVSDIESISRFGDRLQIFGTLEETLSPEVLFGSQLDAFARALHDDYRHRSQDQINPQANVPWHELPEFMKMSNRWRADHTPVLMELAGLHLVRDQQSPAVVALNDEQVELLAQLEHRRYTIERRLIDSRSGATRRPQTRRDDWSQLSEDQKNWNRKEVARLPEIMAGLGIELHSVRTLRLYGDSLTSAEKDLEQIMAGPKSEHCCLIVDLDNPEAVRIATRALEWPSLSLWLFSRDEPPEFFDHKARSSASVRNSIIRHAAGWAYRDRAALDG